MSRCARPSDWRSRHQPLLLGRFARGDSVGCRGVNIERANHGLGLKEVLNHFMTFLYSAR